MKTRTELKLTVGAQYRLGSYQSDGECGLIEIERIEPAENGWYDDHQGGGWDSPGMIYYRYVDLAHKTRGDGTGHAWDACEYARDNWHDASAFPTLFGDDAKPGDSIRCKREGFDIRAQIETDFDCDEPALELVLSVSQFGILLSDHAASWVGIVDPDGAYLTGLALGLLADAVAEGVRLEAKFAEASANRATTYIRDQTQPVDPLAPVCDEDCRCENHCEG